MPKGIVDAFIFRVSEPMDVRPRGLLGCLRVGPFTIHAFTYNYASHPSHWTVFSLYPRVSLRLRRHGRALVGSNGSVRMT